MPIGLPAEILGEVEGSVVSSMSRIESGSTLRDVLVMSGSKIGMNCKITNSVVGEGVHIGSECTLVNVILGDGMVVEAGSVLKDCRIPNPN